MTNGRVRYVFVGGMLVSNCDGVYVEALSM